MLERGMDQPQDMVILLHGIGRTGRSMRPLAKTLEEAGHATLAISYPWRRHAIGELAQLVAAQLAKDAVWERHARVHFVAHSMGGLVARRMIEQHTGAGRIGRVVMLGPPNGGSEVADALHALAPYRWFYGPAGQELTTRAAMTDRAPDYELGVIAGSRGWPYLLGNLLIPVAVARTRLAGMADHIVIYATHSFMPAHPSVHRQVLHFLAEGRFDR